MVKVYNNLQRQDLKVQAPFRENPLRKAPTLCLAILVSLLLAVGTSHAANLFPLGVIDAHLLPRDAVDLRFGLSYSNHHHNAFQSRDME